MRKIPRSFKMPFGSGMIVEEASIISKYHEPTIQLLKFDNGDKVIRFCSYNKGTFSRSPLMIGEKDLRKLGNVIKKKKDISKLISRLSS
jgi:hypothetical protein